jgi:hypothetical protein
MKMTSTGNVIHNLASKEIHSVMSAKDNARPSCSRKILSLKGQKFYEVQYRHDATRFLQSSADELKRIHLEYASESIARDVAFQDSMWEAATKLYTTIMSFDSALPKHRRNRFIPDLYETFFKMESNRSISRPNFVTCMTDFFQHINTTSNKVNCSIALHFDALYDKFDVLSNNSFNWRRFLFYLHLVSHPTLDCRQQLLHAFSFIGSHDGLDGCTSARASVDIHDIRTLLFPLVRADSIDSVVALIDQAWSNVISSKDLDGRKLAPTKITFDVFRLMLADENISGLFAQSASKWGRFDSFPVCISRWEDELYNKTLLRLVRDERTKMTVQDKLQRDGNQMKRLVWTEWQAYKLHQQALRSIFNSINARMIDRRMYQGLHAFVDWSTRSRAALTIQRVSRGYSGRTVAAGRLNVKLSAITIQCLARSYFAKKKLRHLSADYYGAVITLQRIIRGALGRRLAFKKLMTLLEQEHLKNMQERDRLLMLRGIWGLTKLQSCVRRINATMLANELRAMRQRENDIRHAMEARSEKFLKERKVYAKQLEQFYRAKKEAHMKAIAIQSKVARDQVSLRTLRRKLKNDEIKNAAPDNTEFIRTQEWKNEWEMKIERGVEDMKQHCSHCLEDPFNKAEKKIAAQVKKRIKLRTKDVLKRADSRGIPMETKEATQIATQEMLHIIGEEERARLKNEMVKAFQQREKDQEQARLLADAKWRDQKTRAEVFATSVVARACRIWLAKRELRRRCLEKYEKDYDEYSHRFYYRNKDSGQLSWTKPKAMGSFEMPTKNEWKILRDAHNFPYYFNPSSMNMQGVLQLMGLCVVP